MQSVIRITLERSPIQGCATNPYPRAKDDGRTTRKWHSSFEFAKCRLKEVDIDIDRLAPEQRGVEGQGEVLRAGVQEADCSHWGVRADGQGDEGKTPRRDWKSQTRTPTRNVYSKKNEMIRNYK